MGKYNVVITGPVQTTVLEMIRETCNVTIWNENCAIPRNLLYEWVKQADGIFCTNGVQIDDDLLEHANNVKVIVKAAAGYDNVDIDACTKRNIPFGNTPGVLVEATADLIFGLLLCAARRIHEGWIQVKSGNWKSGNGIPFGVELFGKTLGIVGMGSIGAAVARRAQASGMQVIYHNRNQRFDEIALKTRYAKFDTILKQSDFIVVCAPLTNETLSMFGKREFEVMKPTAFFINAARGAIVDTNALYEALKNNEIAYAALDVTDPEPLHTDHPLLQLPNILITPHVGSATHETRARMAQLAVENLLLGLKQMPLTCCVNSSVNYTL